MENATFSTEIHPKLLRNTRKWVRMAPSRTSCSQIKPYCAVQRNGNQQTIIRTYTRYIRVHIVRTIQYNHILSVADISGMMCTRDTPDSSNPPAVFVRFFFQSRRIHTQPQEDIMASLHAKTTPSHRHYLPLDTPKRCFHGAVHPATAYVSNTPPHCHSRILLFLLPRHLFFRLLLPLVEHLSSLKDGKSPSFLRSGCYRLCSLLVVSIVLAPPNPSSALCRVWPQQSLPLRSRLCCIGHSIFSIVYRIYLVLFSVCRSIWVRVR